MLLLEKINKECSKEGFILILMLDQPNILYSDDKKYQKMNSKYTGFLQDNLCRCFPMVV